MKERNPSIVIHAQDALLRSKKIKEHVEFVHEGKKPFKCELCTTSFSNKINLRSHVSCIHEGEWPFQYSTFDATFTLAGVFYNVKNGSLFIIPKSSLEKLSNQNKPFWWYWKIVHFGIFIHVLSWRQQKHKCLLWLLRFSDELFDVINDDPFLTL